jgi:hypothetical protein
MPQMDIMLSPNPEEEPFVTVGWDEGDVTFLWLCIRQGMDWNQVKLHSEDIKKLRSFLMTKQNDDICPEAKELADKALNLSKGQLARAIQDLINTAAEQTAGNLFRSEAQVRELTRQIEHYHGKWGKHDD